MNTYMNNLLQTKFRWLLVLIVSILSVFAFTTSALASGKSEIDGNDNQYADMSAVATDTSATTATPTSPPPSQVGDGQACILLSSGIINVGGSPSVQFVAPEGKFIVRYCVKAQDEAPEYVDVTPIQASVLISHSSGKGIVHFSVFYWVVRPMDTPVPSTPITVDPGTTTSTLVNTPATPVPTQPAVTGMPPTGGSGGSGVTALVVLSTLISGLGAAALGFGMHVFRG